MDKSRLFAVMLVLTTIRWLLGNCSLGQKEGHEKVGHEYWPYNDESYGRVHVV